MEQALEEKAVLELKKLGYTVTTAESCTGGLLAGRLLDVAGASAVYREGHITYANEAKEKILGVSHETLEQYGAVSEETAAEMAEGAASAARAEAALATTGIAGPDGGTPEKPVGLVYIGCFLEGRIRVEECCFQGTRKEIREAAAKRAVEILYEELMDRKEDGSYADSNHSGN